MEEGSIHFPESGVGKPLVNFFQVLDFFQPEDTGDA
jgi:hypothetical protein